MEKLLKYLNTVTDMRQEKKVPPKIKDVIGLVFFSILANAGDWVSIELLGKSMKDFEKIFGITQWDTIARYNTTSICDRCRQRFCKGTNDYGMRRLTATREKD